MRRTQLNLDEKTYYQLVSYAQRENTSLSSAARNLISKQINKEYPSAKDTLLGLVELGKKHRVRGPRDLSTKIDYYLYGPGSPEFGYLYKNKKKT
ncbi:MAG: hypothetical protein ACD_38C00197G0004 [uncultured bacterium]|uniref:Ribbon-helix-helix protein CopG domain-containing protein n=1 Tax=Candidatus Daviesbacteria bacterium GW2011_GWC2_40_12 TaxID=1618431 RepID=A0A0G0QMB6_9BACT|nr:MAG: hypothetical protein ACD_38C00197G0004 [uncultured bacterium]KKQ82561.1 MAG: hypothetical protein UT04_C0057G0009 [Candidatus Daviesbacteria bacterium GW2011_GWF2_38_7]KKR15584.1 MAG: hypothetical protein UT45_C0018G0024 [Candidatus Daviesbacteria bacterium GW2011_GWA2_39_33]KKR22946.1 MAG: hypothetical protein UT54_C0059G0011 [Candidatus Daviesbacteria bacterium GW2011_GWB1_39_5]KKR41268.1 MAG: hypothetical protein UT77_C0015G0010 [Candidatus Daviesbacteria bacterium GW2011_GWC2_40_12]